MDTSELDGWIANLAPIYLQPEVIDGFVQRIDDAIAVANPEVAGDRELRRDVDASTAAQLRVIVAAIAGGSQEVTPPPESVALALTVARRGMDLQDLRCRTPRDAGLRRRVDRSTPDRSGTQARTSGPSVGFGDEMAGSDHRIVGGNVCEGA